jgi:glutathione S-transferase
MYFRPLLTGSSRRGSFVMSDVVVFGFPRSTYVHIVRLVLAHKGVPYEFRDLEPEMGSAVHLALHPFERVPILRHGGFTLYETSAIATYLDEAFEGAALQPKDTQGRARMHQWISSVNSYYYPYMIYHVVHERLVFPQLGIAADEKVVAHAMPKVARGLEVMEKALGHGADYLLGDELTLADFFMLPSTFAFGLTDEGKAIYARYPTFSRWRARMETLPTVKDFRASLPPRAPIEHARKWAVSHRPKY